MSYAFQGFGQDPYPAGGPPDETPPSGEPQAPAEAQPQFTEFEQEQLADIVAKIQLGGLIGAAVGVGIILFAEMG
jgi:hypothetical protein